MISYSDTTRHLIVSRWSYNTFPSNWKRWWSRLICGIFYPVLPLVYCSVISLDLNNIYMFHCHDNVVTKHHHLPSITSVFSETSTWFCFCCGVSSHNIKVRKLSNSGMNHGNNDCTSIDCHHRNGSNLCTLSSIKFTIFSAISEFSWAIENRLNWMSDSPKSF